MKSRFLSGPYILWMILFTLLPCVLIAYYALTDGSGQLTLEYYGAEDLERLSEALRNLRV